MMSGGTTSGRVESSWPNLTKVGPELVEHLAQVLAACGAGAVRGRLGLDPGGGAAGR